MLRDRGDSLNLIELVPTLGLVTDYVLTRLDTLPGSDKPSQVVKKTSVAAFLAARPMIALRHVEINLRLLSSCIRWANSIQPTVLHRRLDHVVELARQLRRTCRRMLRFNNTVVATDIHAPLDSMVWGDGVCVLNDRVINRIQQLIPPGDTHTRPSSASGSGASEQCCGG